MSETKFTKDRWTVRDQFGIDVGGGFISAQLSGGRYSTVAEREANAHLISAAPDMYALIMELKDFAVRQGWDHVLINKSETLLAKARGE